MHSEGLPERLRRATGDPGSAQLDLATPAGIDAACAQLLERLDETNDPRCSELLADLAGPPLAAAARELGRELGLGFDTDELVVAVMAEILSEVPPAPRRIRHFLAHATDLMRDLAEQIVEELKKGVVLPDGDVVRSPGKIPLPELPERKQERAFQVCFHRLDVKDRRILRAAEIERLPTAEIARMLGLEEGDVPGALAAAKLELLDAVEGATEWGSP